MKTGDFPMTCCDCHKCMRENHADIGVDIFLRSKHGMILCDACGNKRCPKASDHHLACTNSNDPGQEGSIYK